MRRTVILAFVAVLLAPRAAAAAPCAPNDPRPFCHGADVNGDVNGGDAGEASEEPAPPPPPDFDSDVYVMPGGHAVMFAPAAPHTQAFFGGGFQFAPLQYAHNTDTFGPSHVALIAQVSLLRSTSSPSTMVLYELGTTLSIERNAGRRFLIPFFGFTFGGLAHEGLGNTAFFYPMLGLNIVWDKHFTGSVEGGYHFPFSNVDTLRGIRAQLSVRFSVW